MMQELVRGLPSGAGDLDRWFGDFRPARLQPQIDVVDTGETLTVAAELPGVAKEDLEVLVEGESLVLRGEKRQEYEGREEGCYHIERAFGRFERRIPLPDNVDPGRAQAEFENAVLRVRIPKTRQQHRARRIDIG
jgi:HSP20 family protein